MTLVGYFWIDALKQTQLLARWVTWASRWLSDLVIYFETLWIVKAVVLLSAFVSVFPSLRFMLRRFLPSVDTKGLQTSSLSFNPSDIAEGISIKRASYGIEALADYVKRHTPDVILAIDGNAMAVAKDVSRQPSIAPLLIQCLTIRRYRENDAGYGSAKAAYEKQEGKSTKLVKWRLLLPLRQYWFREGSRRVYWVKIEADDFGCNYYAVPIGVLQRSYRNQKILFVDDIYRGGRVLKRLMDATANSVSFSQLEYIVLIAGAPIEGKIIQEPDFSAIPLNRH